MSILKSDIDHPESCNRYTFAYSRAEGGTARYIHTYMGDGSPLPSYEGEPTPVESAAVSMNLPILFGEL